MNQQLAIVFEDDYCLALAKPPGQLTQGTWAPAGETTAHREADYCSGLGSWSDGTSIV